jgi:hypothetical protein
MANTTFNYRLPSTVVVENPLPSPTAVDYVTENTKPQRIICTPRVMGVFLMGTGVIIGGVMTLFIALYSHTC